MSIYAIYAHILNNPRMFLTQIGVHKSHLAKTSSLRSAKRALFHRYIYCPLVNIPPQGNSQSKQRIVPPASLRVRLDQTL